VFSLSAAVSGFSAILCLAMKESRPSTILQREIRAITRSSGFDGLCYESVDNVPSFGAFCETSLVLPVRLFFTEPIVFLTSTMAATVSAIIYVFPEAFPVVFADAFDFTPRQCSLVNLAVPVGVLFTFLPRLYDISVSNHCRRNNIVAQPEDKIFGFLVAAPILAIAFWWFGLTIPPLVKGLSPWIPIVSLTLVGFSVSEFDTVLAAYLTDTYTSHAASANASLSFLRVVLFGVLPLFGHRIFAGLGPNNAMFVLAGLATLYCGVAVLFAKYGKSIRLRSKFAKHTLDLVEARKVDLECSASMVETHGVGSKGLQ
jgi:hypothetical protein